MEDSLLRLEATLPGDTVYVSVIVEIGTVTHCEMQEWWVLRVSGGLVAGEATGEQDTDW